MLVIYAGWDQTLLSRCVHVFFSSLFRKGSQFHFQEPAIVSNSHIVIVIVIGIGIAIAVAVNVIVIVHTARHRRAGQFGSSSAAG